jgi:hypothetical protein
VYDGNPLAVAYASVELGERAVMWIIICASIWYLWRLYTLSYNPSHFPDQGHANRVWRKRATNTAGLGATIFTATLFLSGRARLWWALLLIWVLASVSIAVLQTGLVGLIIMGRALRTILRFKLGLETKPPVLAPFVWSYYLTDEEKRSAMAGR